MNNGRLAVLGLAAALGIGTTAAVLEYRSSASEGSIVELAGDDLQAKPREDGEGDVLVAEDDAGAGDDPNDTTRGGVGTGGATTGGQAGDTTNHTTRGGRGTGGKTTGGQANDTTQTTKGGRGTGGKTTGGQANDTTQSATSGGGGVFIGGGGSGSFSVEAAAREAEPSHARGASHGAPLRSFLRQDERVLMRFSSSSPARLTLWNR